eukprot:jgi/Tetstr1/433371/TSEL_022656.t1
MDGAQQNGSGGHLAAGDLPWDAAGLGDLDFADQLLSFADEPPAAAGKRAAGKRPYDALDAFGEERDDEAASSKACREKARRNRLNDRFTELAKLLEEPDQGPKTDKASILISAISTVRNLRREIGQLRQLNKYLEERVGQQEKERGMHMYQQVVAYQQLPPGAIPLQHGQSSSSAPAAPQAMHVPMPIAQHQAAAHTGYAPQLLPQPMYQLVQHPGQSGSSAPGQHVLQAVMGHEGQAVPTQHHPQIAQHYLAAHHHLKQPMVTAPPSSMPPSYLPVSSMDSQKDAMLRPPVA